MRECPKTIHAQAEAWVREFVSDWKADGEARTPHHAAAPRPTDNTGTVDPSLTAMGGRLADAEWDGAFRAGELTGYWTGVLHGAVTGLVAGAAIVALALRAGIALG